MYGFDDRVVIVTGAGGNPGLGRSYALLLASRGAKVVVNDVPDSVKGASASISAESVVDEIVSNGGDAVSAIYDISDPRGAKMVVETAVNHYGKLDILVNNAGVCIYSEMAEMSERDYRLTINANLMGTIWMSQAAWPQMIENGYGRIVNTTSGSARGIHRLAAYGAAKGGVLSFTKALAIEADALSATDITVNAISPAAGTGMSVAALGESAVLDEMMRNTRPEQVAPIVGYLAHEACVANGEIIWTASGEAYRVVFYGSERVSGLDSIESVADSFPEILDLSRADLLTPSRVVADAAKSYNP